MPSSIQDTIKDLASSLKDIKVSKSYKEDSPIPWKRLLAAIGVSMAIVILIIVVAVSIMHDMDIHNRLFRFIIKSILALRRC